MDFFKIDSRGPIFTEKVSTLPSWTANDKGRLIYAEDVNKFYQGDNIQFQEVVSDNNP